MRRRAPRTRLRSERRAQVTTPKLYLREHRDDALLLLILVVALITFLADLLGWLGDGLLFGR
jgi:hypothetical protein